MDNIYHPGYPQRENAEHFLQPDAFNVRTPFESAKLVQITPITMVYGTYNELVTGACKPTYKFPQRMG